ncbi:MAG: transposase [Candidatus Komeilibacteria bacterium]
MPNVARNFFPGSIHHVYNRANAGLIIFRNDRDYAYFLHRISVYRKRTRVHIITQAVLPNHWHFLLQEPNDVIGNNKLPAISKFVSLLSNSYTRYFQLKYGYLGRIFQGQFKSKWVEDDDYYAYLIDYITHNKLHHRQP